MPEIWFTDSSLLPPMLLLLVGRFCGYYIPTLAMADNFIKPPTPILKISFRLPGNNADAGLGRPQ